MKDKNTFIERQICRIELRKAISDYNQNVVFEPRLQKALNLATQILNGWEEEVNPTPSHCILADFDKYAPEHFAVPRTTLGHQTFDADNPLGSINNGYHS